MAPSASLFRHRFGSDPVQERHQLAVLALGLAAVAGALWLWTGRPAAPAVLASLAGVAGAGWLAFPWLGRSVYLLFSLLSAGVGRGISWIVVGTIYWVGIGVFGSLLRLFGMNRLDRDFEACRKRTSMLSEAPVTSQPSFGRQS